MPYHPPSVLPPLHSSFDYFPTLQHGFSVVEAAIVRVSRLVTGTVLIVHVLIHSSSTVIFEKVLDFPVVLLDTN